MNRYDSLTSNTLPKVEHFAWNHNKPIGTSNQAELWYCTEGRYDFRVFKHLNNYWRGEIYRGQTRLKKSVSGSSAELLMEKLEDYYWRKLVE